MDAVREFPLPVVAGINGLALGGGAELAMACDLRVGSANAEIGFLQAQLNVTTAWGGGIDLMLALGPHRALDFLISARRIPAPELLELGLLNYLCSEEECIADGIANFLRSWRDRSTGVMRGFKATAAARRMQAHRELAEIEESQLARTWAHDDHWDAVEKAARQRSDRNK